MKQMFVRLITILFCALMLWLVASYFDTWGNQMGGSWHTWNFFKLTLEATADL